MHSDITVIINAASGASDKEEERHTLAEIFSSENIDARIYLAKTGDEIVNLAKKAADDSSPIVVAGGGDGTVSAVAARIAGTNKSLGVLPLGTLNHFAKDLNIPLELENAALTIIKGRAVNIDVAQVNGHTFINNSSLGLYPEVVRRRERRQRLGYGKWGSLFRSAFKVFRRYPFLEIRLSAEGTETVLKTPFVFVGNNEYEMETFNIGGRGCLDAGHLSLYTTPNRGRIALLKTAIRAFFGRLDQEKDFVSLCTDEILIETRRKQLRVALDGEVVMMETPLRYVARPGVLRVIVPAETNAEIQEQELIEE
ncbi:MAG: sphingosine kinase [Acidobacteria bacterium]|jgi:diacylglycerol kinase family enzyme|nr:sphingosine kinase [Acidobacteriota bacterium]